MNLCVVPEANMQTFPPNNNGGGSSRGYQTLGSPPDMVFKYFISMVLKELLWIIKLGYVLVFILGNSRNYLFFVNHFVDQ